MSASGSALLKHITSSGLLDSAVGALVNAVAPELSFKLNSNEHFEASFSACLDGKTASVLTRVMSGLHLDNLRFTAKCPAAGGVPDFGDLTLTASLETSVPLSDDISLEDAALELFLVSRYDIYQGRYACTDCGIALRGALAVKFSQSSVLRMKGSLAVNLQKEAVLVCASVEQWSNAFGIDGLTIGNTGVTFLVEAGAWSSATLQLWATIELLRGPEQSQFQISLDGTLSKAITGVQATVQNFYWGDIVAFFRSLSPSTELPDASNHGSLLFFRHIEISLSSASGVIGRGVPVEQGVKLVVKCIYDNTENVEGTVKFKPTGHDAGLDIDLSFQGSFTVVGLTIKEARLKLIVHKNEPVQCAIYGVASLFGVDVSVGAARFVDTSNQPQYVVYALEKGFNFNSLCSVLPDVSLAFGASWASAEVPNTVPLPDSLPIKPIKEGFAMFAELEISALNSALRKLGMQEGAGTLILSYSSTPRRISLSPKTPLNITLCDGLTCESINVYIDLEKMPQLVLEFDANAVVGSSVNEQTLKFKALIEVSPTSFSGSLTMLSKWKHPFGINKLSVGPLAAQLGIEFGSPQPGPKVGIYGELELGHITGKLGFMLSPNPNDMLLVCAIQGLSLADLFSGITSLMGNILPDSLTNISPNVLSFQNLSVCLAGPNGGYIGALKFQEGFSFHCQATILSKKAEVYARLSTNLCQVDGSVEHFQIGPLKVHGKNGADPKFHLLVSTSKLPEFLIDGALEVADIFSIGVFVKIDSSGIDLEGNLYIGNFMLDLKCKLEGNIRDLAGIKIEFVGSFKDTSDTVSDGVLQFARNAARANATDIGIAEQKVRVAEDTFRRKITAACNEFIERDELFMADVKQRRNDIEVIQQDFTEINTLLINLEAASYKSGITEELVQKVSKAVSDMDTCKAKIRAAETSWSKIIEEESRKKDLAVAPLLCALENEQQKLAKAQKDLQDAERSLFQSRVAVGSAGAATILGWIFPPVLLALPVAGAVAAGYHVAVNKAKSAVEGAQSAVNQASNSLNSKSNELGDALRKLQEQREKEVTEASNELEDASNAAKKLQANLEQQPDHVQDLLQSVNLLVNSALDCVGRLIQATLAGIDNIIGNEKMQEFLAACAALQGQASVNDVVRATNCFVAASQALSSSENLKKLIELSKTQLVLIRSYISKLNGTPCIKLLVQFSHISTTDSPFISCIEKALSLLQYSRTCEELQSCCWSIIDTIARVVTAAFKASELNNHLEVFRKLTPVILSFLSFLPAHNRQEVNQLLQSTKQFKIPSIPPSKIAVETRQFISSIYALMGGGISHLSAFFSKVSTIIGRTALQDLFQELCFAIQPYNPGQTVCNSYPQLSQTQSREVQELGRAAYMHLTQAKAVLGHMYITREESREKVVAAFKELINGDLGKQLLQARACCLRAQGALEGFADFVDFLDALDPRNLLRINEMTIMFSLDSADIMNTSFRLHIEGVLFKSHPFCTDDLCINLADVTAFFASLFKYLWEHFKDIFTEEKKLA
ncbi:hypothetical protein Pelo_9192 [Pelomyxa schiedti]|nr:hypothetical protein Pelo_9192 [Pelomyxa schiedti]